MFLKKFHLAQCETLPSLRGPWSADCCCFGWRIPMTRFVLYLLLFLAALSATTLAHAYVVREVEPGIVEMKSLQDGSLVSENIFVDKKHHWIYVAVKENGPKSSIKYFYAPFKDFKIGRHQKFKSIQFGVGHRILNQKGRIPFGTQRYFYPLVYFQTAS